MTQTLHHSVFRQSTTQPSNNRTLFCALGAFHLTIHAIQRFKERGYNMNSRSTFECIRTIFSQAKESDLERWNATNIALKNIFGIFIINSGKIVTFLSWNDLNRSHRNRLDPDIQNYVPNIFVLAPIQQ